MVYLSIQVSTFKGGGFWLESYPGAFYGGVGGAQFGKQIAGAFFIVGWNVIITSIILVAIRIFMPLRMSEEDLLIGDDAVHGEEAYALWGDGEKYDITKHGTSELDDTMHGLSLGNASGTGARRLTVEL